MPHPDMNDDIRSLVRMVRLGATRNQIRIVGNRIHAALQKKHSRLSASIGNKLLRWCTAIQTTPQSISIYLQNRDFAVLQRRDLDILYHYGNRSNNIYCPLYAQTVDAVRLPNRIILENTHIVLGNLNAQAIQSWARPSSISQVYGKHLATSRSKGSHFSLTINQIEVIENQLFNQGVGIFYNRNRLFFYGMFAGNIGTLPNGRNVPYVKLQCDRLSRLVGTGTRVELHSYPISLGEIQNDFGNNGQQYVAQIQNNILPIP